MHAVSNKMKKTSAIANTSPPCGRSRQSLFEIPQNRDGKTYTHPGRLLHTTSFVTHCCIQNQCKCGGYNMTHFRTGDGEAKDLLAIFSTRIHRFVTSSKSMLHRCLTQGQLGLVSRSRSRTRTRRKNLQVMCLARHLWDNLTCPCIVGKEFDEPLCIEQSSTTVEAC